jgi:peptidoglycan-N-acetylglucosamine deacetylase
MIIPTLKHLLLRPTQKTVYITFDDGPHPATTPWLTQLLVANNCKATFFLQGIHVVQQPQLIQYYATTLFETANHGYQHLQGFKTTTANYLHNYNEGNRVLKNTPNYCPNVYRPPYGKLTPLQFFKLRPHTHIAWWTLMAYDFDANKSPEQILNTLKQETKAGSIIVFHENNKAQHNLQQVLPHYLLWLAQQGFSTGKISDLLP